MRSTTAIITPETLYSRHGHPIINRFNISFMPVF
jgi:hypothetical protein